MIPPVVGPATVLGASERPDLDAHSAMSAHSMAVFTGHCSTWNFSRYQDECLPEARTKCPSRKAPASRKIRSTSRGVTIARQYRGHAAHMLRRCERDRKSVV